MKKANKILVNAVIFLIPVLVFIFLVAQKSHLAYKEIVSNVAVVSPIVEPKAEAKLSFVGDIMLDRGVKGKVNKFGDGDYHFLFKNADFLKKPDLMFANLEGPVSDAGYNVGSIYSFRFDPVVFSVLKDAGFDVLSMANNHIGDYTKTALEDTIKLGREAGIGITGGGNNYDEAKEPVIKEVNGIKIGYLAFSDFGPPSVIALASSSSAHPAGVLSASDPHFADIISTASKKVDILVVAFHYGIEYQLLSNKRQQSLSRLAIDSGATIVAGGHPHVAEEVEKYKKGVIAYSLGNFIFDQSFSKETMQGLMLNATVSKTGIESYSTSTIYLNENYQPAIIP